METKYVKFVQKNEGEMRIFTNYFHRPNRIDNVKVTKTKRTAVQRCSFQPS